MTMIKLEIENSQLLSSFVRVLIYLICTLVYSPCWVCFTGTRNNV